jgi:hypothetical protein
MKRWIAPEKEAASALFLWISDKNLFEINI